MCCPRLLVTPNRMAHLVARMRELFPHADGMIEGLACIKTDFRDEKDHSRSLNVNFFEPFPGPICAIPGKMTEAPYLADALAREVFERLDPPLIARRPMDTLSGTHLGRMAS
jgi:hypothetical protein